MKFRLIPARAGNTKIGHASTPPSPAHPRSRGEHEVQRHLCTVPLGSSPLARGTRLKTEYQPALARLIPARAGNTSALQRCVLRRSAHPRSRGEHASGKLSQITSGGSSPLARGTHFSKIPSGWSWRLIPARAGNTPHHAAGAGFGAAHPRSRGEHGTIAPKSMLSHGSSPLARGTHPCSAF